ncbi:MAG: BPSS1780 family membrane protein [Thiotrichales bacterium]
MADQTPGFDIAGLVWPRRLPVAAGGGWIARGFALQHRAPFKWTLLVVGYFVVSLGVAALPGVGIFLYPLLTPVWLAGLMHACAMLSAGQPFALTMLFSGLRQRPASLLLAGALYLLGSALSTGLALVVYVALTGGVDPAALRELFDARSMPLALFALLVPMLMAGLGMLLLAMAFWFVPVLLMRHPIGVLAAIRLSFSACAANLGAFVLWGLVALVAVVAGLLALGVGLLLVVPPLMASIYVAYREILAA